MADLPLPLVQGLSERTVAFIEFYCEQGGHNATRAAIRAGFAETSAQRYSSKLLRDTRVLGVLRFIAEQQLTSSVSAAVSTLTEIRDDLSAPHAVRRQCANDLLDRGGMLLKRVSTLHHIVEDRRRSNAGDLRELVELVVGLDIGVAVTDPARLTVALEWAAQRDQHTTIDITAEPEDGDPEPAPALPGTLLTGPIDPPLADLL